jgi:hypothetical protein
MWWRPKEPSRTNSEIRLVHKPHALHVPFQGLHQAGRQHSAPVLDPLQQRTVMQYCSRPPPFSSWVGQLR